MKHTLMFFKFPENFPISMLLDHHPGIPVHRHEEKELILVLEGTVYITMDGQLYTLHAHDVIMVNSFTAHTIISEDGAVICSVLLNFSKIDPYFKRYCPSEYLCNSVRFPGQNYKPLWSAVGKLALWSVRPSTDNPLILYSIFYAFLFLLNRDYGISDTEKGPAENESTDRIRQIRTYIFNHYREPLSLQILADVINITPQYLSRLFKEFTGESVLSYITSVRLNFAYQKLFDTSVSLESIARDAGFPSVRSFSSAFRQVYGQNPGEYRKTIDIAAEQDLSREKTDHKELLQAQKKLFAFGQREEGLEDFPVLRETYENDFIPLTDSSRSRPDLHLSVFFSNAKKAADWIRRSEQHPGLFPEIRNILMEQWTEPEDFDLIEQLIMKKYSVSLVMDPQNRETGEKMYSRLRRHFPQEIFDCLTVCIRTGKNTARDFDQVQTLWGTAPCLLVPVNLDVLPKVEELSRFADQAKQLKTRCIFFASTALHPLLKSLSHELELAENLKILTGLYGSITLNSQSLIYRYDLTAPFAHAAGMILSCDGRVLFENSGVLCVQNKNTYKILVSCAGTDDSEESKSMNLTLLHMENGTFEERIFLITNDRGNLYDVLSGFDDHSPLTQKDRDYINSRSLPEYKKHDINVTGGVCPVNLSFASPGMALIVLKKLD